MRTRILARAERSIGCGEDGGWPWKQFPCCEWCGAVNGQSHPTTGSKVVLMIAHLNHNPADNVPENLAALCQKCHNNYDAPVRQIKKEVKRQVWDAMKICCGHLRGTHGMKKKPTCTLRPGSKTVETPQGPGVKFFHGTCVFSQCPLMKAYRRDYRKEKRKGDGQ